MSVEEAGMGTPEQLKNPDYMPPMGSAIPLGIQHVLAMFVSNLTPAIIIGGAAGFAFGGSDAVFLIQMSMLFAGVATLFQTIGFGPVGARLPVMQGTSFAKPLIAGAIAYFLPFRKESRLVLTLLSVISY